MTLAIRPLLVALLLGLGLASPAGEVSLVAAASLRESLDELSDAFAKAHPGLQVRRTYGASGALAKQVEAGAPADLFVSANAEWMDLLRSRGLVDAASVTPLARNALVLVGRPGAASALTDLPRLGRVALGSPKSVPAGAYALEALKAAGLEQALASRLVYGQDVRACLMYAERGEVDGAFVYASDALQATKAVLLFRVPAALHAPILYPMALTVAGARKPEAVAFFAFLRSPEARAVLIRRGFLAP